MKKIFVILFIVISCSTALAQYYYLSPNPLTIKAYFDYKDSSLVINYKNNRGISLLLWAGSWNIDYINRTTYYFYLAKSIRNGIYLYNKKDNLSIQNYHYDIDSSELNSSNYYLLSGDVSFELRLNANQLLRKGFDRRGLRLVVNYTVIDAHDFLQALLNSKVIDKNKYSNSTFSILSNEELFYESSIVNFTNIKWDLPPKRKKGKVKKIYGDVSLLATVRKVTPTMYYPKRENKTDGIDFKNPVLLRDFARSITQQVKIGKK